MTFTLNMLEPYGPAMPDGPSMEDKVFAILREHGMQTLHELGTYLPNPNWAQIVLAVDRLNRSGRISLWWNGAYNYLLAAREVPNGIAV
jgi:hypothetical protein